jgi:hypothetical protein
MEVLKFHNGSLNNNNKKFNSCIFYEDVPEEIEEEFENEKENEENEKFILKFNLGNKVN